MSATYDGRLRLDPATRTPSFADRQVRGWGRAASGILLGPCTAACHRTVRFSEPAPTPISATPGAEVVRVDLVARGVDPARVPAVAGDPPSGRDIVDFRVMQ